MKMSFLKSKDISTAQVAITTSSSLTSSKCLRSTSFRGQFFNTIEGINCIDFDERIFEFTWMMSEEDYHPKLRKFKEWVVAPLMYISAELFTSIS